MSNPNWKAAMDSELSALAQDNTQHLVPPIGAFYPGYREPSITTQNSRYNRFPPAVNGWGTIHPVPDVPPPLLAKEEGAPI
jgi:hypothetical protein